MNFFEKINLIMDEFLNEPLSKQYMSSLDEVVKLAHIIIKNPLEKFLDTKYVTSFKIDNSVNIVKDFFETINPNYSNMFQNILYETNLYKGKEDYFVKFSKIENIEKENSSVDDDGLVNISYSDTLYDTYLICHEITHKFSTPKKDSILKKFLGETSSICMEFLLQDYLIDKYSYNDEFLINKYNRIQMLSKDASAIIIEYILLQLYKKNGCLTKDIILDYLKSKNANKAFINRVNECLNLIVSNESLTFPRRQRYVIGTLLASDLHNKIKSDKSKITDLFCLINILGHADYEINDDLKILKKLGILNNPLNENDIKRLTSSYKEEIDDILFHKYDRAI